MLYFEGPGGNRGMERFDAACKALKAERKPKSPEEQFEAAVREVVYATDDTPYRLSRLYLAMEKLDRARSKP